MAGKQALPRYDRATLAPICRKDVRLLGSRLPLLRAIYSLQIAPIRTHRRPRRSAAYSTCVLSGGGCHGPSRHPDADPGAGAPAQHLGHRGAGSGDRRLGADRLWRPADHPSLVDTRRPPGIARPGQSAVLRAPHDPADAAGDGMLHHFHLYLCRAGRQEPARRDGADPVARHPAVSANPRRFS